MARAKKTKQAEQEDTQQAEMLAPVAAPSELVDDPHALKALQFDETKKAQDMADLAEQPSEDAPAAPSEPVDESTPSENAPAAPTRRKLSMTYQQAAMRYMAAGLDDVAASVEAGSLSTSSLRKARSWLRDNAPAQDLAPLDALIATVAPSARTSDGLKHYRVQSLKGQAYVRLPVTALGLSPGDTVQVDTLEDGSLHVHAVARGKALSGDEQDETDADLA